jgi:hypothetical protein
MNKAKLKTYAPQARKDFIAAVTARAYRLGLAENNGELYRLTLIAQCKALSSVMPFPVERIDNETELLLPGNLLRN